MPPPDACAQPLSGAVHKSHSRCARWQAVESYLLSIRPLGTSILSSIGGHFYDPVVLALGYFVAFTIRKRRQLGPVPNSRVRRAVEARQRSFAAGADCEVAFPFRLRQALTANRQVMQPFDQEQWAKRYAAYSLAAPLTTFSVLRQWNLALVRRLVPWTWRVNHPERSDMTLQAIVETMGGHDRNHLMQVEGIAWRRLEARGA